MGAHHYTDSAVKTAAAAANAGTCLEDGNSENNIFSNVGSAVKAVSQTVCKMPLKDVWTLCH